MSVNTNISFCDGLLREGRLVHEVEDSEWKNNANILFTKVFQNTLKNTTGMLQYHNHLICLIIKFEYITKTKQDPIFTAAC